MRLSNYFLPLLKENPKDAEIPSHKLMLRAGMIRQLSSGIYNWLPLGLRVLKNIENIVRYEMDQSGALELLMPTIQPSELWQESERYDGYGKEMLRIKDRHEREMLYGPTNEEVITDIFRRNIKSYKDLPKNLYHIQWKFRDEIRPRFGVMRGREFLMKDAYSFDINKEEALKSFDIMYQTYLRIFKRLGLKSIPVAADSGAIGGDYSREFHVIAETGESELYYDARLEEIINSDVPDIKKIQEYYAAADEKHDPKNCNVPQEYLRKTRGIEVGHIFYLGTKYSEKMAAKVADKDGKQVTVEMGCYGIGVSRLVGAVIEAYHDEAGIIWPESIAPYRAIVINLKPGNEKCDQECEKIYREFSEKYMPVLYDDRNESPGNKFAAADLIGVPFQIIIGPKSLEAGMIELKNRITGEKQEMSIESLHNKISSIKLF